MMRCRIVDVMFKLDEASTWTSLVRSGPSVVTTSTETQIQL